MDPITMTVLIALGLDEGRDFVKGVTKNAFGQEMTLGLVAGKVVGGAGRALVESFLTKPAKEYTQEVQISNEVK